MAVIGELGPLATEDELTGLPGAPFTAEQARIAGDTVRRLAGWHIAPQVEEILTVDHDGSDTLFLPSKLVVGVSSVRDLSGSSPRELGPDTYRWSADGMLRSKGGRFPEGFRVLEVTFEHGYPECPGDLLPAIASRAKRRAVQESIGSRNLTYESSAEERLGIEAVIRSYRVRGRV